MRPPGIRVEEPCPARADAAQHWANAHTRLRGTPLAQARTLFEGATQDVAVRTYVDQDGVATWQDYNCGARSYDGHNGVDIFTWPYGWLAVDESQYGCGALRSPGKTYYVSLEGNDRGDGLSLGTARR